MGKTSKVKAQKKVEKKVEKKPNPELWGIIFLALGLFILIALISHLINPKENILGPFLGTYLASGLIFLLGKIPSFLFPLVILFCGYSLFKRPTLNLRVIVYSAILIIELEVLLSIHNLPKTLHPDFTFVDNGIGNAIVFLLHYIFGPHVFGPYFLFSLGFLLTSAIMFEINIGVVVHRGYDYLHQWVQAIWAWLSAKLTNLKNLPEKSDLVEIQSDGVGKQDSTTKNGSSKAEKKTKGTPSSTKSEEDEAALRLEQELAAFRAKKDAPITISTPEHQIDIIEPEDEQFNLEDSNIEDASAVDPSLFEQDIEVNEEFGKIPSLNHHEPSETPIHSYKLPESSILKDPPVTANVIDRHVFEENSHILEKTLLNFGVEGKVVNVSPGPVVTRYEIELAPGIKISKIVNLHDDLSMAVGGKKIRIEAPIPGKAAIGIELPNLEMQLVSFKHILESEAFRKTKAALPIIIGKTISGIPFVSDITRMPHLLIAGQTGSGKSVAINSFLCSLLMTKKPDELRLILIDPKKVEMSYYENIPHLLAPVVTESKEAVKALQWGVMEMTRRYRLLAKVHARNIDSFNQRIREKSIKEGIISENDNKSLPFIVIIVDELADLMLTASRDVEGLIQRIAQLARAVGIHLVVATQRPSVDIITGPIKANLTSRIAFRTIQSVDSRTILGCIGAEKLLGRGDMLFLRNGAPDIERFHGSFISEEDVELIVEEIKKQHIAMDKIESFDKMINDSQDNTQDSSPQSDSQRDEKFEEAARLIVSTGLGSTSLLQRRLKLGYARAGRLMDELHEAGIVGPQEGSKTREVLVNSQVLEDMFPH